MVEVYYYIPAEQLDNALGCGIKLSSNYDMEIEINGELKKCLTAYINPKDNMKKYNNPDFRCLKLSVLPKYCYVAEDFIYQMKDSFTEALENYKRTIIPIEKYIFGSYRLPVCLVTSTIIADDISVLDKRLDSPVLYNNAEELYLENLIESGREKYDGFNDAMLYCFFSRLADKGIVDCLEDYEKGMAVFLDKKGKVYGFRTPDLDSFIEGV